MSDLCLMFAQPGKYQYMQSSLTAQRSSLKTKLPDIVSALDVVQHLAAWAMAHAAPWGVEDKGL